jgi:hypothetical protein
MAFSMRDLSVLAYANGFTLWHYKTAADDQNCTTQPGFFDAAGDMLAAGDMMMISARDGGRMVCIVPGPAGLHTAPLA